MGVALVIAGVGVTLIAKDLVWYGAVIVGLIQVARGVYLRRISQREP